MMTPDEDQFFGRLMDLATKNATPQETEGLRQAFAMLRMAPPKPPLMAMPAPHTHQQYDILGAGPPRPKGMSPLVWAIACHYAGPEVHPNLKQLEDAKLAANVIAFLGV